MKLSSLEAIVSALGSADVRYLVVGGLAVAAHGHGRATFDVQLLPDNVARAMRALEGLGYRPTVPVPAAQFADPRHRESWIRDKNMIVFQLRSDLHPETSIDIFVTEPFDFDMEYDAALVGDIFPDLPVRFVGLETLIRMKESAGRAKDIEDIRQLRLLKQDNRP